MSSYDEQRREYRPDHIKFLLVAESPPPNAEAPSSRHFYRLDPPGVDRLFINTIRALYPEIGERTDAELRPEKQKWLKRLQADGIYMIEALETSMQHKITKKQRQENIKNSLPRLIERVGELVEQDTKLILIKSNVFDIAAEPLKAAGFTVLNTELVDYPGRFNQRAYREKLAQLVLENQ
jgi:hypothetical protein